MARCIRCNACRRIDDFSACCYCGYPAAETRTTEQILREIIDDMLDWIQDLEIEYGIIVEEHDRFLNSHPHIKEWLEANKL